MINNRVIWIGIVLGLSCILLMGFVCGVVGYDAVAPATPLVVVDKYPAANAHDVGVETAVSITYDQAVVPSSVSSRTVSIHAMQTGLRTANYVVDGGVITFTPTTPFKVGEMVQVSVITEAQNSSGEGALLPTVWGFRTAVFPSSGIFFDSNQALGDSDTRTVNLGDLDGDGDLDALTTSHSAARSQVWFNDGLGIFSNSGQQFGESYDWAAALGDVDGDGDLDAVTGNYNFDGQARVWANDGTGIFTSTQTFSVDYVHGLTLGDVNGDGRLDVVFAKSDHPDEIWFNDGEGFFGNAGTFGSPYSNDVALADLDGDDDLDLFVVKMVNQPNEVWLNNGLGVFSNTNQALGGGVDVALGDVDADGDVDALVANGSANQVWLNNGSGYFIYRGQSLGSDAYHVMLVDSDGDGDLDGFTSSWGQPTRVWRNVGSGVFLNSGQSLSAAFTLDMGDLDFDGDLDAFLGTSGSDRVGFNESTPSSFRMVDLYPVLNGHDAGVETAVTITYNQPVDPTSVSTTTITIHGMQTGRLSTSHAVNGGSITLTPTNPFKPGELVLVSATTGTLNVSGNGPISPTVWQFRTEALSGSGFFSESVSIDTTGYGLDVGDVDGDGDLDFVIGNNPIWDSGCGCKLPTGANTVWFNTGLGTFVDSGQRLGNPWQDTNYVELADLDSDGDLDALFVNSFQWESNGQGQETISEIWMNPGSGYFTSTQYLYDPDAYGAHGAAIGDVDGDSDLDLILGKSYSDPNPIWFNDGSGNFTIGGGLSDPGHTMITILFGDMDNDADLDIVTNEDVWLNDGTGDFSPMNQDFNAILADLGDVNEDGWLDVVAVDLNFEHNRVWLNTGNGVLIDSGQILGDWGGGIALADVDADGDLDAYVSRYPDSDQAGGEDMVWFNQGGAQGGVPGVFADSGQRLGNYSSGYVFMGDFNDDGSLDAFAGGYDEPGHLWLNEITVPLEGLQAFSSSPTVWGGATWFTATITSGNAEEFAWDFGDGSVGQGVNPSHFYETTGLYTAVVTASNSVSSLTATTMVTVVDIPIGGLTAENDSPTTLGQATQLTATVTSGSNVTYTWDLGDGTVLVGPIFAHIYPAAGVYTAVVTASNSQNALTAVTRVFIVKPQYYLYLPVAMKPMP